jgi:glyoxylase-like metal-dependent hydrolase (beta-lactamase superfamily II)
MRIKKASFIVLVMVFCAVFTSAQIDFDQVQIETTTVANNIYMLGGGGGNIGVLVGEDGVLLIDSMFAELEEKMKAAISKLSHRPIQYVLNTNWHYDHVMGNASFAKIGATILAHETTRERMSSEQYHPFFDMKIPAYPNEALPVITFAESLTLHFSGEEIFAFHVATAHSDADLAFYFRKANVLHTGDLYFSKGYPFIDYNHGGGIDGMIASTDKLIDMVDDDTKIIPGHGPLSDREGLRHYRQMLTTLRDRVSEKIREGKSLEETVASKPTSDFDKGRDEGMSPDDFVKIVYNDLTKKSGT